MKRWQTSDWLALAGIALAGAVLTYHARVYLFLTDDAYISFRYARNLADGHGLVFNPGMERVEGATNFLWVLLIAAWRPAGVGPEQSSLLMSFAATAALFAIVVRFVWARAPEGRKWIALVPAVFLAATRSFAVWSSSGLETRLFELLLVGGVLSLVGEVESSERGASRRWPLSPWLFGLASLTRPDGPLVGGCALLAAAAYHRIKTGRIPWGEVARWWPFAALVAGQAIFRLLYFGDLLPNTYYVKVGANLFWGRGLLYVATFALEYGALLWIPALVVAARSSARRGAWLLPTLFMAAVVPHLLFVMAIGGDHFEYRPLDVYLPFLFIAIAAGIRTWATSARRAAAAMTYVAVVVLGLVWFPLRSHREFTTFYRPGFPGTFIGLTEDATRFLAVNRDPIFRLPGLDWIARAHRAGLGRLTAKFAGIRQEEHKLFLQHASESAGKLEGLIRSGILSRDVYVAMDCVGVIPYRTNVRTLDRLGLTDKNVAHSAFISELSAHGKYASFAYGRERGVDLWSGDAVSLVVHVGHNAFEKAIRAALGGEGDSSYAADLGDGEFLFCRLPRGPVATARRFPRLHLEPVSDSALVASYLRTALPEYEADVARRFGGPPRAKRLGEICYLAGHYATAAEVYRRAAETWPENWRMSWMLALSRNAAGDAPGAEEALAEAVRVLRLQGGTAEAEGLIRMFDAQRRKPAGGVK